MDKKTFEKNEVIFNQGEVQDFMFDIVSGKVGIYVDYDKESENKLTELSAGDLFGEMGMIDNLPRSATAVALEATQVNQIGILDFADYFRENPESVVQVIKQLTGRLRELTVDYMEACATIAQINNLTNIPEVAKAIENADNDEKKKKKSRGLRKCIKKFAAVYKEYDDAMMEFYNNSGYQNMTGIPGSHHYTNY